MSYAKPWINGVIRPFAAIVAIAVMLIMAGCTTDISGEKNQSVQVFLSSIALQSPNSRIEQLFNQRFEAQILNPSAEKAYQLKYSISGTSSSTLSVRGSSSTLVNSSSTLNYALLDAVSGEEVLSGSISAQATSGTISSYYGQEKSKQFTSERLAGLLSEKLMNKLGLFYISQYDS